MTNKHEDQWEARYRQKNTGWDRGNINPQLSLWMETGALQACRILVPGCGNGYEVLALAAAGFDVVAVDIAATPVMHLRGKLEQRSLKARVVQADLLSWDNEEKFDAIYEQTCLCALSPDSWRQYEQQLYHLLTARGKMYTLFMQTQQQGGPPFHCELSEMRSLFPESRWAWHSQQAKIPHPAGFYELPYILEKEKR